MIVTKIKELQIEVDYLLKDYRSIKEINVAKKDKYELLIEASENMLKRDLIIKKIESKQELIKKLSDLYKEELNREIEEEMWKNER